MKFSYISHLYCSKCSEEYNSDSVQNLCKCGNPLLVKYDINALVGKWKPTDLEGKDNSLWRYHEILPVKNKSNIVSMGEGMTPLIRMDKINTHIGIHHLFMKDEGVIPTGTFKARGAAVGVSKAKELGIKELVMPTNGNAGAAWSLYAARSGIATTIVMPVDAPKITRNECAISGSNLYLVNGLISDAGKIVGKAVKEHNLYDVSTLKEPYRIEGKKTMGLEIAEQFNWNVPDVILYPTGGGVGLIGIHKALKELQDLGWIKKGKLPRLVAVQSKGCAPIVKAWQEGKTETEFWYGSKTLAFGINVPKALGDFLVLNAIYDTKGCAVSVSDEELLNEQKLISEKEGLFICPEGAAAFNAARKLRNDGWIEEDDKVVVLNTGAGIKYPDTVRDNAPILKPNENIKPAKIK